MVRGLAQQAERGLLGLFILVLIWAPLPLASNREWGVALLALMVWTLLPLSLWARTLPGAGARTEPQAGWPGWAMAGLLVLFGVWAALPLLGWGDTADRHATGQYVLRTAVYLGAWALVLLLARSRRRRMALMTGILVAGVLQALVAVLLFSKGTDYRVFHHTIGALRAAGTFANPDHLAQYMVLTLSAGLGVMLAQMGQARPGTRSRQERLLAAVQFVLSPKMLVRLLLVLLVLVLVLTRSRAGNGAFFLALFLLGGWVMVTSPSLRKPAALLVTSLLVVDLIVIGQWVGLDKVVQRLQSTELAVQEAASAASAAGPGAAPAPVTYREETLDERLRPVRDTLQLIEQRPWTGWGAGSFYTVFQGVKRESLPLRYDHAHNDYVEIAADTGLVGLGLLGLLVGCTAVRLVRLTREQTPASDRGLAAGVGVALFCALVHATVDFNLHITANALLLTVLLAVAWSMPLHRKPTN